MESLRGRDVLLVEDIIDTGLTMQKLIPVLQEQAPSSIKVRLRSLREPACA